jgi:hypothetical protein
MVDRLIVAAETRKGPHKSVLSRVHLTCANIHKTASGQREHVYLFFELFKFNEVSS